MGHVSDVEFNADVVRYLDAAAEEPVVVERQHGKPSLVVMALAEFESWQETAHLLASAANAERLLGAVGRIRAAMPKAEGGTAPIQSCESLLRCRRLGRLFALGGIRISPS